MARVAAPAYVNNIMIYSKFLKYTTLWIAKLEGKVIFAEAKIMH